MKKLLCLLGAVSMLLALTGCGKTKVLHCDHCGAEVTVKEDSNMEEEWIIYCGKCEETLFDEDSNVDAE